MHAARWVVGLTLAVLLGTDAQLVSTASSEILVVANPGDPRSALNAAARPRPNVVLILVDDMAATDLAGMPNVRRLLGRQGTTFDRAYSPYPLCRPARATLLTGRYAHNHNVMGNDAPWGGFRRFNDRRTLPVRLKAAGYRTAMIGKYLNGYEGAGSYVPPGWSRWRALTILPYEYRRWHVVDDGRVRARHGYQTDVMSKWAVNSVRRYAPGRRPFFLWLSLLAPHDGGPIEAGDPPNSPAVARRHRHAYDHVRQPRTPAFNEADISDKPRHLRNRKRIRPGRVQEVWRQRREALLSVDDGVASIIRALRRSHALNNTLVIFTSDNGMLLGEHRVYGKSLPYEEAAQVPLIIRGPGFPAGRRAHQQVTLADIAPTIARAARVRPRPAADGLALQRLARRPDRRAGRPVLFEAGRHGGITPAGFPTDGEHRWYVGVRSARDELLVRYANGTREYYDMRTDPYQLTNRARRPGAQADVRRLMRLLRTLANCRGAECR